MVRGSWFHTQHSSRLFVMYHCRIDEEDKGTILQSLTNSDGNSRVVFCTIAFGMDVNITDIATITMAHHGILTLVSFRMLVQV